jgi:hypothetical protein
MKKIVISLSLACLIALSSCGSKEYTCTCTLTDATPTSPQPTTTTETVITGKKKDATTTCETGSYLNGYLKNECKIN